MKFDQQASIYQDFSQLNDIRLAGKRKPDDLQAITQAAKQFESIFVQMMLKSMRDASAGLGEDLFGSNAMKMYRSMYDEQLAVTMSDNGGIGIAEMMVKQLAPQHFKNTEQTSTDLKPPVVAAQHLDEKGPESKSSQTGFLTQNLRDLFAEPTDFVQTLYPIARAAASSIGLDPKMLLAQAALETGWGKKIMGLSNGESSHNLFSIKADKRWDGDKVAVQSLEYYDGIAKKETGLFRAYESFQESFNDYINFIQGSSRYQRALQLVQNPEQFIESLANSGYATDPEYSSKVTSIYHSDLLNKALPGL